MAPSGQRLQAPHRLVSPGESGLPIIGHLIEVERHYPPLRRASLGEIEGNLRHFRQIVRIRAVDVVTAPFVADAQQLQDLVDRGQAEPLHPVDDPMDSFERPAGVGDTELLGITPHDVQESVLGRILRGMLRGKKRACARVLCESSARQVPRTRSD